MCSLLYRSRYFTGATCQVAIFVATAGESSASGAPPGVCQRAPFRFHRRCAPSNKPAAWGARPAPWGARFRQWGAQRSAHPAIAAAPATDRGCRATQASVGPRSALGRPSVGRRDAGLLQCRQRRPTCDRPAEPLCRQVPPVVPVVGERARSAQLTLGEPDPLEGEMTDRIRRAHRWLSPRSRLVTAGSCLPGCQSVRCQPPSRRSPTDSCAECSGVGTGHPAQDSPTGSSRHGVL